MSHNSRYYNKRLKKSDATNIKKKYIIFQKPIGNDASTSSENQCHSDSGDSESAVSDSHPPTHSDIDEDVV